MVNFNSKLGIRQQCKLLELNRSRIYYQPKFIDDTCLANMIAQIYKEYPVYGYRRITACLKRKNIKVNGKCVLRLMQEMQIKAIYPSPKTTVRDKLHYKYPYLLGKMLITKPHQAWQIDITYLRTDHGFMYMNALIDMRTRYVVGWSLSNSLDVEACLRSIERAIMDHGTPDLINSDQGSQFTVDAYRPTYLRNAPKFIDLLFGKGYIDQVLFRDLFERGLKLVTGIKKKMQNKLLPLHEKILLRKRSVIETV